jgi:hypothetical protein
MNESKFGSVDVISEEHEKKERPPFVYHGSSKVDIEELKPYALKIRSEKEGPVVFAAPNIGLAAEFIVPADDTWSSKGLINGVPYIIINGEKRFKDMDKGGAIYKLPSDSFSYNPKLGMGKHEWVSNEAVRPLSKTIYESALDAMLENGVQVFFIENKDLFKSLSEFKSLSYLLDTLNSLQSENQKQQKNVIPFEQD